MLRPLPPFRMRPRNKPVTPKLVGIDLEKLDQPVTVRSTRRPMRVPRLIPATRLRVLGRAPEAPT